MNQKLTEISNLWRKNSRTILSLMSGTSLDGLDVALCKIEGYGLDTKVQLLQFETRNYTESFKADVRSVFSKKEVNLEKLTLLNAAIATTHAKIILECISKWNINPPEIDCIASHGQTIYHAPRRLHQHENYPNATLQIGDADHLSVLTGIPVIADFRQKHIAAGGEGAPLALYGDRILFSSASENRVMLNIGGIANFTYLPSGASNGRIICTDTGPGNTLIDALAKKYFDIPFDQNGQIALSGQLNEQLLTALKSHPFFSEQFPKTTGPELFNLSYIEEYLEKNQLYDIKPADLITTLTHFTVDTIVESLDRAIPEEDYILYLSGGGAQNKFLVNLLQEKGIRVKLLKDLGVDPDAKEAILFAILANETLCGSGIQAGAGPAVMMGKISLPI